MAIRVRRWLPKPLGGLATGWGLGWLFVAWFKDSKEFPLKDGNFFCGGIGKNGNRRELNTALFSDSLEVVEMSEESGNVYFVVRKQIAEGYRKRGGQK